MPVWNTDLHFYMELELANWWQGVNPLLNNENLIGYWPGIFNDAGQIIDLSHNQNHLTNHGATAVTGTAPHHLDFNGSSYAELTTPPSLVGSFTFGGWFKFAAPSTEEILISKGELYSLSNAQALLIGPAASWTVDSLITRTANDDDGTYSGAFGQAVPTNQWCFLAGGARASSPYNDYIIQINDWGLDYADSDHDDNTGNSQPIRIGSDSSGSYHFTGQAAKFWIINEALTNDTLTDIYNHQRERFGV